MTQKVAHTADTIGWGQTLQSLEGLWVNANYIKVLHRTRSIARANQFFANEFVALSIHPQYFKHDSLWIAGIGTQDQEVWYGVLLFNRNDINEAITLQTPYPPLADAKNFVYLADVGDETVMALSQTYDQTTTDALYYYRMDKQTAPTDYTTSIMRGAAHYLMVQYVSGQYRVENAAGDVLAPHFSLYNNGSMSGELPARYHLLAWQQTDVIHFETLPQREEALSDNQYYGINIGRDTQLLFQLLQTNTGFVPTKTLVYRLVRE